MTAALWLAENGQPMTPAVVITPLAAEPNRHADSYVNCLRDTVGIWRDTKGNQPYSTP